MKLLIPFTLFILFASPVSISLAPPAYAQEECEGEEGDCPAPNCSCTSEDLAYNEETGALLGIEESFVMHREWLIKNVWEAHVLPAMMLMTHEITTMAFWQMEVIGSLFDAKHQLETQRLLQDMQATAHKEYHPSEGMCRFGTNTRSLAAADRKTDLTQISLAARSTQRLLLNQGGIGTGSARDEQRTRMIQFRQKYCNPDDLGFAMYLVCESTSTERRNKDVNFMHTVGSEDTLPIDFSDSAVSPTEEDVLALSVNLYGHRLLQQIDRRFLANAEAHVVIEGAKMYMDIRALAAKRSVAYNSFAAFVAEKSLGAGAAVPYMREILIEMDIPEAEIEKMLGGGLPSYHAQMEILTKKLYQIPNFYSDLYGKPVNIDRKNVSMQAIGLMQKRDMYKSQLRAEANMAVYLETWVERLQEYETNEQNPFVENSGLIENLGLEADYAYPN